AALALAERRAGDLKVATEKLGGAPISNRQLWTLRIMGVVLPPPSAGLPRRIGGILLLILAFVVVMVIGFGIVTLISLPFGGGLGVEAWFYGFLLVVVVLGVLVFLGRRKQKAARAKASEQRAAQLRGR